MWSRRSTLRWKSKEMIMAVAFSADDRFVATGHFDGAVTVYDASSGSAKLDFNVSSSERALPVTGLRFHPTQPVLLVTTSDGSIEKRDIRTGEAVAQWREEGNEVYCVDYRRDGKYFATGGSDGAIRVYDDASNRVHACYQTVPEHTANHSANRMYSVVFAPDDLNYLYAGGWGNTVHVYDLRVTDGEKKNLFGPYLTGDALDVRNGLVLVASNRLERRIELIDSETEATNEISWPSVHNFCPTSAKMSRDAGGEYIAIGGGGGNGLDNAAFVLERRSGKCVVDQVFEASINALAFSNSKEGAPTRVVFGDGVGHAHIFERPVRVAPTPAK
jgi:WD40 repeat protein